MPPAIRTPVPSTSLLRFLRSQTEASSIFSRTQCAEAGAAIRSSSARLAQNPQCLVRRLSRTGTRSISTSCRRPALVPASPFSSDPVTTRIGRKRRAIEPHSSPVAFFSTTCARRDACDDDSSSPRRTWKERLWGIRGRGGAKPLKPNDLPFHDEGEAGSMFNSRRILTAKAALEPRLRCTEVDENGEVILVDGEFKKTELIAKYGLLPRDLRKIDSSNLPHIFVRQSAILLNLLHLKVLIKKDRVLLFDVYGSKTSYPQSAFMYDLQGKLKQKNVQGGVNGLPYEFRALEAVLTSVTSELEADFESVRDPVIRVLSELEDDIDRHKLRVLLILSKRVSTFEQKAKLVRDAIEELLEADDDLTAMYLTEKAHDLYRGVDDHTEVELLLESYNKLCDEIVQEAQNLVSGIRNTEEIIRAILDANRNALMLLDLRFSVGTLGLAMGTFLAGLYGMNLENFIEDSHWGFAGVTITSTICSLIVCWYGLVKLRKVQRVKMMFDERGPLTRTSRQLSSAATQPGAVAGPHWLQDDGPVGLLDARNREKFRRVTSQKAAAAANAKITTKKWFH
ncbi:CorA-like Mg2+ transporter [Colletotrichum higginsianum IMI 349063]|uniref:Magnesium transporter n=4 Tax=Colletotrichum higginsianum TaxID=80884 RepID=A0A1B7Y976_COLHI|nr:CorA-like Mg2+ transporter [Colletotrichum higginsianum IMI 349063]OBR08616.1 CorA-like Mg2+ transporter [Colletotrichum higginsianum IMI 349063]TIC95447.1 Mitochondrial inner membrane magnesium transporter MRS2 [Colletotrichum higginsianum]GJC97316.1 CorA-like Mg2+ transporter [Colletotrichum higginsianum]